MNTLHIRAVISLVFPINPLFKLKDAKRYKCGGVKTSYGGKQVTSAGCLWLQKCGCLSSLFLVFTHVMRRPRWCTKQWENVAQVLHNNIIKFPKDFFTIVLYTNMAAVMSHENRELAWVSFLSSTKAKYCRTSIFENLVSKINFWSRHLSHDRLTLRSWDKTAQNMNELPWVVFTTFGHAKFVVLFWKQ